MLSGLGLLGIFMVENTEDVSVSFLVWGIGSSFLASAMTAQDTGPEPDQRPQHRGSEGQEPHRPGTLQDQQGSLSRALV